jgi:tyrosine-protein phosphatase SIW14
MSLIAAGLILFISAAPLVLGADPSAPHVRNFERVNDRLFRGGEPTPVGLQELGAMGVKIDIDLRGSGEGAETEKQQAEKLGMKYVNVPFSAFSAPTNEQVQRVLSLLLQNDSTTVFVHCRRGKDRTGTVIACYRIEHDGWKNDRALEEAKQHGMSFTERAMRSYILRFTPLSLGPPDTVARPPAP